MEPPNHLEMASRKLRKFPETFQERHRRLSLPVSVRQFVAQKPLLSNVFTGSQSTITKDFRSEMEGNFPESESETGDIEENDDDLESSSYSDCDCEISPRLDSKSTDSGFTDFSCRDLGLAPYGREEIEYAKRSMRGLALLLDEYQSQKPLEGVRLSLITHINAQTATAIEALIELGASVRVAPCNVYSTHNAIVAALAIAEVPVFGWHHQSEDDFWWCIDRAICCDSWEPNVLLDDGGDGTRFMIEKYPQAIRKLTGIIEESMSGVHRLFRMWKSGTLSLPAINLFDSLGQGLFNNFYLNRDNIVFALKQRADIFMAGSKVLIVGFGKVGRSTALGLRSAGCRVDVAEINPVAALMATMEGFNVVRLEDCLNCVDVIITATGSCKIIHRKHCDRLKSGAVLLNIGHYSTEIDIESLRSSDLFWRRVRPSVHEIIWPTGKRILLLNEGRSLNLATQHSSSFVASINATLRIMAVLELFQTDKETLANQIYRLTEAREEYCARLHLPPDVRLSQPSDEQKAFNERPGSSNTNNNCSAAHLRY